jgi:hypothetical protein
MKNNILTVVKKAITFYSVLFTFTTIASSILQLVVMKQVNDTNSHILNRAVVVLIATITITVFESIKLKSKILSLVIPYIISMGTVFLYVWVLGHFGELAKHAYRDIFINFTAITIVVCICIKIKHTVRYRKKAMVK